MDGANRRKIERLKLQIRLLNEEIVDLSEGCNSWFCLEEGSDSIQCGHGYGQCPNCAPKEEAGDSG